MQIKKDDIRLLLDNDGDINDLIVYLLITAITAPFHKRVLEVETHIVSMIIEKTLKHIKKSWFQYDIILCPTSQKYHWHLVLTDVGQNFIIQYNTLSAHDTRCLHNLLCLVCMINIHYFLKNDTDVDFDKSQKHSESNKNFHLHQNDRHLCRVQLLIQAKAYTNGEKEKSVLQDRINLYRRQVVEDILRLTETVFYNSMSHVSTNHFDLPCNLDLSLIFRYPISSCRTQNKVY